MKIKLLALIALAGGTLLAQPRVSIGVGVNAGPSRFGPAAVIAPVRPGYVWVEGYWTRTRFGRACVPGYWMRRPHYNSYRDNYRVAPRFYPR